MSDELEDSQKEKAKLIYQHFIHAYLSRKDLPASLKELKEINKNFSAKKSLEQLSPEQKAELIFDPDIGALEDEALVKKVLTSFKGSPDDEEFKDFFKAFAKNNKLKNITLIKNPGVRDTILNLTLTALAPEFEEFEPEDFKMLFQDHLAPVLASLHPGSLAVIPNNISCHSYRAILAGLGQSLESLPLHLSDSLRSSIKSLKERFTRCSLPDSFMCKKTPVNENLICAAVNRSHVQETLSVYNSSEALCRFTLTEHACSSATHLTASNLVTLMNCTLESNRTHPTEVWKLLFQKASPELDKALETFATMAPGNSNPSLSHALEALGEVRIANFSQTQLQSDDFVSSWFQTNIRPFLASTTPNFLFCLSSKNFSCETYQTVIKAFSSQMASMDMEQQQAVYTHFIRPFLSRNDSSDPGCVSFNRGSKEWLQGNFGNFSGFAKLRDLQHLNANFSSAELLPLLTPTQVAELTLSSGALNDTDHIDRVFERLQEGDALENVEEFLTQLTANGKGPDFQPVVRDRVMNRTFSIISPRFTHFMEEDWFVWFHKILVPVLPSFSPMMIKSATANISCKNFQVVVSGMSKSHPAMSKGQRKGIGKALLGYLDKSTSVINKPVCRQGIQSDAEWLEAYLGAFSQHMAVVDSLSPEQKTELILDTDSGALEDEALLREVLTSLIESPDDEEFEHFLIAFAKANKQKNITLIKNPGVRDTILNLTLTALAPEFEEFEPEDFKMLFQDHLAPVLASLHPGSLAVIPNNISCHSYRAILAGLGQSLESLPLHLSDSLRSSIKSLKERFTRCSLPDSFMCKKTENLICAAVNRSHVQETLSVYNSSEALCRFTLTEHACSSATHLTASNLVTLMNCTLESNRTHPTEVWKLLFQKASPELDKALETFATMAPGNSNPSLSHALEALGEVRIANFSQTQLQSDDFVSSWFQTNIRPFLASTTPNFLFCLSSKNFSCETYQTVIKAFSSQMASMDMEQQQAVYTHFIRPFLSRNDSSDPGCVSFNRGSKEWLQGNFGNFSGFAKLRDLQHLNANFSSAELLPLLTPTQVAELTLSSGALNDTDHIDRVFERLQEGDALENVEEFLTQLTANGKGPDFQPVFQSMMIKSATANISCKNFQVVVSGMSKSHPAMSKGQRKGIGKALLGYLDKSASVINKPVCRQGIQSDAEWLEAYLGAFSQHVTYSELKAFNLSAMAVVDSLSPEQKAELILDTDTNKQKNITLIKNPGVRDTILNLTLTALAPEFEEFEPEDFKMCSRTIWLLSWRASTLAAWRLSPITSAVTPTELYSLVLGKFGIPAIAPFGQPEIKHKVTEGKIHTLLIPDSFMCKKTPVNENLICAAVNRSHVQETLSVYNPLEALCRFTLTEHACSSATHLTASNLVTLMNCTLESNRTHPTEVWKLLFQKASPELDKALETFATMAPGNSNPSLSHALEALGEVRIANFSQTQLQSDDFVSSWFQTNIRPFLASTTPNFLFCLSSKNFSCETYQTVIKAFSSQMASMDMEQQQAVYTHFIRPFLSRNDSSDPGCVSFNRGSKEWLQGNFGNFSGFAKLRDLQHLNANFSSAELLPLLTPTQVAELTLSSGALNDTDHIDRVFERLQEGDALENVEEFLTQLTANGKGPDFQPVVRDRVMNRTFSIISPRFTHFMEEDWFVWFHKILVPVLPSFSPMMIKSATANISCKNFQVVVSGMSKSHPAMSKGQRKGIGKALLGYLDKSTSVINKPVCRQGIQSDAEWLEAYLGAFSQHVTYSDLKAFNLSAMAVVDSLSPEQKTELILDTDSGALEDEALLREVLTSLIESPDDEEFEHFLIAFAKANKQKNITLIKNPGVRDTILNLTLTALAPEFEEFEPEDFKMLFQDHLAPVLASLHPGSLAVIPNNISCHSYRAILAGLGQSLESLPLHLSDSLRSSIKSLKERFTRCSLPDSFMCKKNPVNENLICAAVNRSHVQETLSVYNSSEALCRFTLTEHACSSATHLTASNLVTLMNCTLESNRTHPTESGSFYSKKLLLN
ncbi:Chromosomal replication initiator protein DnaA [Dissostichus eleginoides]|uniref:Chromosomal replication initiator protein DnaA n=1 Tax=Dissostichus eleginoides TaxID=100907 RepID=A0AAD9F614_DISEL|nr:Chromosomal replication initiator protein DnaA [Dissostichus eleginoides]